MNKPIITLLIRSYHTNRRRNMLSVLMISFAFFLFPVQWTFAQAVRPGKSLIEVNPPDAPDSNIPIALVNGRMVDVLGGKVVEDAIVVVKGNRIVQSGPAGTVKIPENAEVVDMDGMTILPGLIDAHLHTINNNGVLNTFLRNGVTTMRDPGHPFRFYQSINFSN